MQVTHFINYRNMENFLAKVKSDQEEVSMVGWDGSIQTHVGKIQGCGCLLWGIAPDSYLIADGRQFWLTSYSKSDRFSSQVVKIDH